MTAHTPKVSYIELCNTLEGVKRLLGAFDAIWTHDLLYDAGAPVMAALRRELDTACDMADRLHGESGV